MNQSIIKKEAVTKEDTLRQALIAPATKLITQFITQLHNQGNSMQPLGWFKSVGLIAATSIFALPFIFSSKIAQSQPAVNRHLKMGNPSNARGNLPFNYLMLKDEYALSYNSGSHIPNWVSWQLNDSWLGSAPRQDKFRVDPDLPSAYFKVSSSDYTNSGFSRGHMVAAGDRTKTVDNNKSTFLMTNIIPQSEHNNNGPWEKLETYLREKLVKEDGKELYIIAGGYGRCGTGSNGRKCTLVSPRDKSKKILVPASLWKIIVVLDKGSDAGDVTEETRVIAVAMPNIQGIRNDDWTKYRVSVNHLENQTGHNFLSLVDKKIQDKIEKKIDDE